MAREQKEQDVVGDIVAGIEMHDYGWELFRCWLNHEIITIIGYTKFGNKFLGHDEDGNAGVYALEPLIEATKIEN